MPTETRVRGADALVRALKAAGVRQVFALSGNHIMPVFDALIDSGIALVHTRHEAAAVHMADAWARITGEPGIALVTGGPGHANALSALYTAQMAESPVVLLSGHAPREEIGLGAFQEMHQAEMAAAVTKAAWTSAGADTVAADVARALRMARGGRSGPVNLNLPSDALHGRTDSAAAAPGQQVPLSPLGLAPETAQAIVERLARAARPLILAGPGCSTRRGRAHLMRLEQACRFATVVMESPRGVSDPGLGAFREVLALADCILLLGKRLDFTLKFGRAPALLPECEFLQIDSEENEFERTRRAVGGRLTFAARADVAAAIDALIAKRSAAGPASGWAAEVRAALDYRPAAWESARASLPDRVHPAELSRPLQAVLDGHPDSVLVVDGGEIGQWAQACLHAPHRVINGVSGSIGGGLPFALGARCAEQNAPVIAVMGDGTFGFHAAEMDTAVTHNLRCVAVVGNDARWNAEYQIQLREYGADRAKGCALRPLRYDEIARAFGAWGECVMHAEAMPAAVSRALASRAPACINVMIEGLPAPEIARRSAEPKPPA